VIVLLGQFILWVRDLAFTSPLIAWPLGVLAVVAAITGVIMAGRGVAAWRTLDRRAVVRHDLTRLAESELHGESERLLAEVRGMLQPAPGIGRALRLYDQNASDALSDGERIQLFERIVLDELDARAVRIVGIGARDIAVLTTVPPTGLLDALVVLTRTRAMLRRLSTLYGVPADRLTTLRLLRLSFRNAALAGAADVLVHATAEHLGASIAALLSAKAGQGAGNALLAGRLGLQAIRLLRPAPFLTRPAPKLVDLRGLLDVEPVRTVLKDADWRERQPARR
jgi:putative membrane protein